MIYSDVTGWVILLCNITFYFRTFATDSYIAHLYGDDIILRRNIEAIIYGNPCFDSTTTK